MRYKLREIFDLQMGKTPSRNNMEYWKEKEYKWISIADLSKTEKYISETKEYLSDRAVRETGIRVIPANTVVMSFKLSIGKVAITTEDMYSNEAIMAFHDKHVVEILPEYIFYLFKWKKWDEGVNKAVMGKTLNKATLSEVEIKIYPVEKQKEIINVLDKVMEVRSGREKELKALDELIKARFVEMFDLAKCPYGTFGHNTDFLDYRGKTPELSEQGTIRMVNAKAVGKGVFKTVDEYVTEDTYDKWMRRGYGYPGDILFVTEGHTFGNTCLVPNSLKKFALGQRVITIKGQTQIVNNAFLCTYMQMDQFIQDINVYKTGGTAQGIRSKDLVKVRIPLPDYDKQEQFAAFVAQIDKSKVIAYFVQYTKNILYQFQTMNYEG